MINIEFLVMDNNTLNHLTVCKQMGFGSYKKSYRQTICLQII